VRSALTRVPSNARYLRAVLAATTVLFAVVACTDDTAPERLTAAPAPSAARAAGGLDAELQAYLATLGFTGRVASTLETRLGRRVDHQLADVGRMLWFDTFTGLNDDNSCAGCHSPTNGLGDTQPIAIGIDNNGVVGPGRRGPRNQRRTPMAINTAFYPTLMWNSRFRALSGNPFDNGAGFLFPAPEGASLSAMRHLLVAQAFIPPTERVEVAGFAVPGDNFALRDSVVARLNSSSSYRALFGRVFDDVRAGAPITFEHFGRAVAEFEFTQVYADAPIDRFARGISSAMSDAEKRGAVLFFGKAGCVSCHSVSGASNEMFSDFREHVIGVPQIVPSDGNVTFDGPGANEDFGLEQVTGLSSDRYAFRSSPLRNVALQAAFMHNGAFVRLEDAIRHHLDPAASVQRYSTAMLPSDFQRGIGPSDPVLAGLDARLATPTALTEEQLRDLVAFVRDGLLDPAARPDRLRRLIPEKLPSGRASLTFQFP
jgi:cytochrome c peroxidase